MDMRQSDLCRPEPGWATSFGVSVGNMPRGPRNRQRRRLRRRLALLALVLALQHRNSACVRERMNWEEEVKMLLLEGEFARMYRMPLQSFNYLLALVAPVLDKSPHSRLHRGSVPVEVKLQLLLDYLAGGIANDVRRLSGISRPYFYAVLYETMDAIISIPELQIKFPETSTEREHAARAFTLRSKNGVMNGCVAAMDGWLCKVRAPISRSTDGAGARAYFSGHYARMGINVQACCDAFSRFVYLDMSHPGGVNDIRAYRETGLPDVVESMETGLYVVADNAYKNTDHLLTPFLKAEIDDDYKDSFNFHLSQLRIRIEMAFGLFVRKWGIFQRPLQHSLEHVTKIIHCAAIIHNFVITERLNEGNDPVDLELRSDAALTHLDFEDVLTYSPSDYSNHLPVRGVVRDGLVEKLRGLMQLRPS